MTDNKLPIDLSALMEAQLAEGLALLGHAREIVAEEFIPPRDRTGAMGAAARLMLANARAAETLARLQGLGGKETVYRQIVEVKRPTKPGQKTEEELEAERIALAREIYLSTCPSPEEVKEREAREAQRIAEGRPEDENTWCVRRQRRMKPYWEEMDRAEQEERSRELTEWMRMREEEEGEEEDEEE